MTTHTHNGETPAAPIKELPPRLAGLWIGLYLAIFLCVPMFRLLGASPPDGPWGSFFRSVAEILRSESLASPAATNRRLQMLIDEVERRLETESPILEIALPRVQQVLTTWGGVGNTRVILGRDGWLFYRPGFDYVVGPPFLAETALRKRNRSGPSWLEPPRGDPRPAILDLHHQLQARGIPLLLVVVPTKVMVYGDALSPEVVKAVGSELHNPSFPRFRRDLEAGGVAVLDTTGAAVGIRSGGRDAFLRTDSHWSPETVDAVARVVAERVRELGVHFEKPRRAWRATPETVSGEGDLARLLELPGGWGEKEQVALQRVSSFDGRPWQADPEAEILLLGDSFSNVFSVGDLGWGTAAGFAERLSLHLGRTLDRFAVNDGSATACRRRWTNSLAAGERNLESLRLVIYQVAVRELSGGDWRPVSLEVFSGPETTGQ